jgi:protein-disulfide isomerase
MITFMRRAVFLAMAGTLLACSPAPAQSPSDVAARVGGRAITVKELDERWRAADAADQAETIQKLYDGRRAALEAIVADALLAEAAKTRGLSSEAYVQAELSKRVKPVTDADVAAFYSANIGQMQGQPLSAMAPAITRFLTEQQENEARLALINELRKSGPAVNVLMEAPRFDVELSDSDPSIGSAKAPVTLIEFSDFQCPFCLRVAPTLKKIRQTYGDRVRIVWKDFPLTQIHPQAFKAGEAGHCAAEQGKFWEYHDQLFGNQQALLPDDLKRYAAAAGMDAERFSSCLDTSKHAERVREGVAQGTRLGVNSTPTVFVNGRRVSGAQPYEVFAAVIDEELSRSK